MRRRANGAAEDAQEVEFAQPGDARQRREVERFVIACRFDRTHGLGDSREFARRRARGSKRAPGEDRDDARRRLQRAFFDPERRALVRQSFEPGDQRRQGAVRRRGLNGER